MSHGFRFMARGAQVIRVPWSVCPLTKEPDGIVGLYWKGWGDGQQSLIPRQNDLIDTSWWRPPFETFIIVSEKSEPGCLLVTTRPGNFAERTNPIRPGETLDWSAQLSLVGVNPAYEEGGLKLISLLTVLVHSVDGRLSDCADLRPKATAAVQSMLADDELSLKKVDYLAKMIDDLWTADGAGEFGHRLDTENVVCTFSTVCALLSCKNVEVERVRPDRRLQEARVRRGNLPLVSWHVLKVRGLSRRGARGAVGGGEALALHWVRGHFKRFTAEKPLFGRITGNFWWYPHLAGQADRVVIKDYSLESK